MTLEVYVMPLARYLSGDFEPAQPVHGEVVYERSRPDADPAEAAARVSAIQKHMSESLGVSVDWEDVGEVAFAECTDGRVLHGLRSLAAFEEYPRKFLFLRLAFQLLRDPRDHASLRRIYDGDDTRFSHLMRHSDNRGFWFPIDFPEPCDSNEPQWWRIGSCQGLARELADIAKFIEGLAPGADRDELTLGHAFFDRAVSCALDRRLPLIFDG